MPSNAAAEQMITCAHDVTQARAIAGESDQASRLVSVCMDCTSKAVKLALSGFKNLSHGFCPPCHRVRMAEAKRNPPVENLRKE